MVFSLKTDWKRHNKIYKYPSCLAVPPWLQQSCPQPLHLHPAILPYALNPVLPSLQKQYAISCSRLCSILYSNSAKEHMPFLLTAGFKSVYAMLNVAGMACFMSYTVLVQPHSMHIQLLLHSLHGSCRSCCTHRRPSACARLHTGPIVGDSICVSGTSCCLLIAGAS